MKHPLHLSDKIRRKIAKEYLAGKVLVKEICEKYGVSTPTVRYSARMIYPDLFDDMKRQRGAYERKNC